MINVYIYDGKKKGAETSPPPPLSFIFFCIAVVVSFSSGVVELTQTTSQYNSSMRETEPINSSTVATLYNRSCAQLRRGRHNLLLSERTARR